jgi:hypothetical protein
MIALKNSQKMLPNLKKALKLYYRQMVVMNGFLKMILIIILMLRIFGTVLILMIKSD